MCVCVCVCVCVSARARERENLGFTTGFRVRPALTNTCARFAQFKLHALIIHKSQITFIMHGLCTCIHMHTQEHAHTCTHAHAKRTNCLCSCTRTHTYTVDIDKKREEKYIAPKNSASHEHAQKQIKRKPISLPEPNPARSVLNFTATASRVPVPDFPILLFVICYLI